MSVPGVAFIAPCPGCGQDCQWTGYMTEQPSPYSPYGAPDLRSHVHMACDCEGIADALPVEVQEIEPVTAVPERAAPACAHGRPANCPVCVEAA